MGSEQRSGGAPCEQCVLSHACPEGQAAPSASRRRGDSIQARSCRAGQALLREGQLQEQLLFVKSGLLALRQTGVDGVERAVAVLGRGAVLGVNSFHGLPSLSSAVALSPVSVCEIPLWLLRFHERSGSAIRPALLRAQYQTLRTLLAWSQLMRMPSLSQRMAAALRLIAQGQAGSAVQLPSQTALAELLCVQRESVNRTWRELAAAGVLRRCGPLAVELDLARLDGLLRGARQPESAAYGPPEIPDVS